MKSTSNELYLTLKTKGQQGTGLNRNSFTQEMKKKRRGSQSEGGKQKSQMVRVKTFGEGEGGKGLSASMEETEGGRKTSSNERKDLQSRPKQKVKRAPQGGVRTAKT